MSRILSGKLQVEQGRVELVAVVTSCIQSLRLVLPASEVIRDDVTDEIGWRGRRTGAFASSAMKSPT